MQFGALPISFSLEFSCQFRADKAQLGLLFYIVTLRASFAVPISNDKQKNPYSVVQVLLLQLQCKDSPIVVTYAE